MDSVEIAKELLNYLNENGLYNNFLFWAEERGFDLDELENDIDNLDNLI